MTPEELAALSQATEQHVNQLAADILAEIIDRVRAGREITSTTDYLIWRYDQIKGFDAATKKYIQHAINATDAEITRIFDDAIAADYARDISVYGASGLVIAPIAEKEALAQYITAVRDQTRQAIANLTNTMGYTRLVNGRRVFTPMATVFEQSLDATVGGVLEGGTSYNEAIKKVCGELVASDLRTVSYPNKDESKPDRSLSIEAASRMCVMTAAAQVVGKLSERNMDQLHTAYVEVSAHDTARPTHQEWQGRVFYWSQRDADGSQKQEGYDDFVATTGYGVDPVGLLGINCYHTFRAFVPGVSIRSYTDAQLQEMKNTEQRKLTYNGKEYTRYEAAQKMRALETRMRKERARIAAYKRAGADVDDITLLRCRYRATKAQYKKYSSAMGLPEQYERVYSDGYGRV